jgi:hypothetical protein
MSSCSTSSRCAPRASTASMVTVKWKTTSKLIVNS